MNAYNTDNPRPDLQIKASGMDFLGFRLGLQYQPPQHPNLQLGFNYRLTELQRFKALGGA